MRRVEGDALGLGKGHENGGDPQRVEFTEQEVAVKVDQRQHIFQHLTNLFFHIFICLSFIVYGLQMIYFYKLIYDSEHPNGTP